MAEEERVAHEEYKCPSCGAPMHFDPASHSLKCDYCDTVIKLNDENSGQEFSLDDAETEVDLSWQQENHVLRCSACGAENVVNKKEMSLVCPFCGSTQVVEVNELAGKKPNRIIPFNITEEAGVNNSVCFPVIIFFPIFSEITGRFSFLLFSKAGFITSK